MLGVPSLSDYVTRMQRGTIDGHEADEGALVAQWRAAAERRKSLQSTEAGIAENVQIRELPAAMAALVERVLADPVFVRAFDVLPIAFGLVELDTLVVYQRHVVLEHVERLTRRLGPEPSEEAIFRICLPFDRPPTEVHARHGSGGRFIFQSPSTDLRFIDARLLPADALTGMPPQGPLAGVIALLVGFGSNYLNVVRVGRHMALNNGYHRAYALRSLGITHAPCVIQAVAHHDELAFAGGSALTRDYRALFDSARPPLFKDFFDPALTQVVRAPRTRQQLQVSFSVEMLRVPE